MIRRILRKIVVWAMNEPDLNKATVSNSLVKNSLAQDLNLSITNAVGGKIIVVSYYNNQSNQHYQKHYLSHEDEDFAETLAHIITVENLSR